MYNTHTATNRIGRQDCLEFNVEHSTLLINFGVSKICIKFGAVKHFIL
mgnify:CR=1 FL=1